MPSQNTVQYVLFANTIRLELQRILRSEPLPAAIRTAGRRALGGWPGHAPLPYSGQWTETHMQTNTEHAKALPNLRRHRAKHCAAKLTVHATRADKTPPPNWPRTCSWPSGQRRRCRTSRGRNQQNGRAENSGSMRRGRGAVAGDAGLVQPGRWCCSWGAPAPPPPRFIRRDA